MKKFLVLLGALFIVTGCIGAGTISGLQPQGNNMFPKLEGIDLLGKKRDLPAAFEGKLNIISVAFEREHQEDVNPWIGLALEIMKEHKGVRYYEVPLIYELNAPSRFWVNNGMRSGIPDQAARERTITVFTDRPAFTGLMNMDASIIYTLLLDDKGKILWRTSDVLTDEKAIDLKQEIRKWLK